MPKFVPFVWMNTVPMTSWGNCRVLTSFIVTASANVSCGAGVFVKGLVVVSCTLLYILLFIIRVDGTIVDMSTV